MAHYTNGRRHWRHRRIIIIIINKSCTSDLAGVLGLSHYNKAENSLYVHYVA